MPARAATTKVVSCILNMLNILICFWVKTRLLLSDSYSRGGKARYLSSDFCHHGSRGTEVLSLRHVLRSYAHAQRLGCPIRIEHGDTFTQEANRAQAGVLPWNLRKRKPAMFPHGGAWTIRPWILIPQAILPSPRTTCRPQETK